MYVRGVSIVKMVVIRSKQESDIGQSQQHIDRVRVAACVPNFCNITNWKGQNFRHESDRSRVNFSSDLYIECDQGKRMAERESIDEQASLPTPSIYGTVSPPVESIQQSDQTNNNVDDENTASGSTGK